MERSRRVTTSVYYGEIISIYTSGVESASMKDCCAETCALGSAGDTILHKRSVISTAKLFRLYVLLRASEGAQYLVSHFGGCVKRHREGAKIRTDLPPTFSCGHLIIYLGSNVGVLTIAHQA
jgi:hypothetical protein